MKTVYSCLASLVLLFVFCTRIKAQILINEFSQGSTSDWVELYNIATVSADLSTYKLMDSGTNDKSLTGSISPGGFISFSFSNWLNNSTPDGVRLYNGDTLVDSIFYGAENQVCFASDTGSIGRYPDGGNTIDRFLISTRDSSNNQASLFPCPSPTPNISPTTAATTAPTLTPLPTSSNVPTSTPAKTYASKPSPNPTSQILGEEVKQTPGADALNSASVPLESDSKKNFPYFAVIIVLTGLALIGFSFFLAFKKRDASQPDSLI